MASFKQKDIKLLWGRSGNRCSICQIELTQDKDSKTSSYTLGEQAHIVGEKEGAARGKSLLTLDERNTYHNLILLCPNHHTEIDSNEDDWPVEKLHQKKSEHELWVNESLSYGSDQFKIAQQVTVTAIVDSAVELCNLDTWQIWTSWALAAEPHWKKGTPDKIEEFRHKAMSAIWPENFEELKRATITFSILIKRASDTFMSNSELMQGEYFPYKFYKKGGFNKNYDRDLEKYEEWLDACTITMQEATKAANWFADIVRQDLNPMFYADKGRFLITEGPFMNLSYRTRLIEFSDAEKKTMPEALSQKK